MCRMCQAPRQHGQTRRQFDSEIQLWFISVVVPQRVSRHAASGKRPTTDTVSQQTTDRTWLWQGASRAAARGTESTTTTTTSPQALGSSLGVGRSSGWATRTARAQPSVDGSLNSNLSVEDEKARYRQLEQQVRELAILKPCSSTLSFCAIATEFRCMLDSTIFLRMHFLSVSSVQVREMREKTPPRERAKLDGLLNKLSGLHQVNFAAA